MPNRKELDTLPLNLQTREGYLLLQCRFNIALEVLASAIKQKWIKCIHTEKQDIKQSLFADGMIVYVENSMESIKIAEFNKLKEYKTNIQKSITFHIQVTIRNWKNKSENKI